MIGLNHLIRRGPKTARRGQVLVLVALSMIGLLVTAGIAVDVGFVMMRKAQFDRAVDAAALAGAQIAGTDKLRADDRGRQILAANGIGIGTNISVSGVDCPLPANRDYCGSKPTSNIPGAVDYHVEARWTVPLIFMQLMKVHTITLVSSAQAQYYNSVDVYTSGNDQGVLQSANLEQFGRDSCASNGDAYSPDNWGNSDPNIYHNSGNAYFSSPQETSPNRWGYTYRIAIPDEFDKAATGTRNMVRVELYDPQTANLNPTGSGSEAVDNRNMNPDLTNNPPTYQPNWVVNLTPAIVPIVTTGTANMCTDNGGTADHRTDRPYPCLHGRDSSTPGFIDFNNPFWYVRMDEIRGPGCGGLSYTTSYNEETLFKLYYYQQTSSGALVKRFLAQYTGKNDRTNAQGGSAADRAEAFKTALTWVSPVVDTSPTIDSEVWPTLDAELMPAFTTTEILGAATLAGAPAGTTYISSPQEPRVVADACPAPCSPRSNGDFTINLDSGEADTGQPPDEAPGIYQDPNTKLRYLYLDVFTQDGSAENNYSIWAGPSPSEDPDVRAPAFVNARQVYLLREKAAGRTKHGSRGVITYGVGHLPFNSASKARTILPLGYIGPELGGAEMSIKIFDVDAGTRPPIMFFYDTIPVSDWSQCFGDRNTAGDGTAVGAIPSSPSPPPGGWLSYCDYLGTAADRGKPWQRAQGWDAYGSPPGLLAAGKLPPEFGNDCNADTGHVSCGYWTEFRFRNPTDSDPNTVTNPNPMPFYGGRLMVSYQAGQQDSFGWWITVDARPSLVY